MANDKDFKVKNGIQPTVYHEAVGTVTSGSIGPSSVFSTDLYTGTGSDITITNGINLSGDGGMVWIKSRDASRNHQLTSSDFDVAGGELLFPNTTGALDTRTDRFKSFNSDGFTVANGTGTGNSGENYVAWTFKKHSSFFDSVTYTGNGTSGRTVSHSLGSVPGMIIVKSTSPSSASTNWAVYHRGIASDAETDFLRLNLTSASEDNTGYWNDTAPTSTEFTVGNSTFTNNGTYEYVAYLFGHDTSADGYIQCGSNTQAVTDAVENIDLGWPAAWVMVKRVDGVDDWKIVDLERGFPSTGTSKMLRPNQSNAESTTSQLTSSSNGFNIKTTAGQKIVYVAIRDITTTKTLDLSTGSVFEINPTSDIQIGLSNPAPSNTVSQATLVMDSLFDSDGNPDITTATYDHISLDVTSSTTQTLGLFFKPDGKELYLSDYSGDQVDQYSLTTAWDISTATYTNSISVSAQDATPYSVFFKPDGTKMYILGRGSGYVYQYSLSTAWDVTTATYDGNTNGRFLMTQVTQPVTGFFFKDDGTSLYIMDNSSTSSDIYQYTLSTAWDISTASYASKSFAINDGYVAGLWMSGNGKQVYWCNYTDKTIEGGDLTTAWDISTASESYSFSIANEFSGNPFGLFISSTYDKMYVYDDTAPETVYQYSLVSPVHSITYDSTVENAGGSAPSLSNLNGGGAVLTFSTRDGGTSYQAAVAIDGAK
jgi:hypothetical protein